ncbi:unnamed protein product, partial [Didymodactylos carnosus]
MVWTPLPCGMERVPKSQDRVE